MVPQQSLEGTSNMQQTDLLINNNDSMAMEETDVSAETVFGSQMVAKDSNTPYSDATQVSLQTHISNSLYLRVYICIYISINNRIYTFRFITNKIIDMVVKKFYTPDLVVYIYI